MKKLLFIRNTDTLERVCESAVYDCGARVCAIMGRAITVVGDYRVVYHATQGMGVLFGPRSGKRIEALVAANPELKFAVEVWKKSHRQVPPMSDAEAKRLQDAIHTGDYTLSS